MQGRVCRDEGRASWMSGIQTHAPPWLKETPFFPLGSCKPCSNLCISVADNGHDRLDGVSHTFLVRLEASADEPVQGDQAHQARIVHNREKGDLARGPLHLLQAAQAGGVTRPSSVHSMLDKGGSPSTNQDHCRTLRRARP